MEVTAHRDMETIVREGSVVRLNAWGDPGHSSMKCLPGTTKLLSVYTSVDPGHTGKSENKNLLALTLRLLYADHSYKNACQCLKT